MAKKRQPRWGYQRLGIPFKKLAIFSDDQVSHLAGLIGVDDADEKTELKGLLDDRASLYRIYKQHEEAPGPPEIRATLSELRHRARGLHDLLSKLDRETAKAIVLAYDPKRFDYEEPFADGRIKLHRDIRHLKRLRSSLAYAHQATPKDIGGRPDKSSLKWLALSLAEIYEAFSGSKDKFVLSDIRGRTGPRDFVSAALRIVEPAATEVTEVTLETAMRHAVRELNERRRNQKPPRKRG